MQVTRHGFECSIEVTESYKLRCKQLNDEDEELKDCPKTAHAMKNLLKTLKKIFEERK